MELPASYAGTSSGAASISCHPDRVGGFDEAIASESSMSLQQPLIHISLRNSNKLGSPTWTM